jgi:hypothetical protein
MHFGKGLEFKAVAVMACDDDSVIISHSRRLVSHRAGRHLVDRPSRPPDKPVSPSPLPSIPPEPGRGYDGGMNHVSLGPGVAAAISTLTAVAISILAVFVSRKAARKREADKNAFYEKQHDNGSF